MIEKPFYRPRRLRKNHILRDLVKETYLSKNDLIYPIFIAEKENIKEEINSMPEIYRQSIDYAMEEINNAKEKGIKSFLLFGIPNNKDDIASSAYDDEGVIQKSLRKIKKNIKDIVLITDVCNCEYTSHGHCGIIKNNDVDNDSTLDLLVKTSLSHARAGADIIAPSDMMDGRIFNIRKALNENGFENIPIMSYSAKFSSFFYGPFREAAQSNPSFGDRKTYQIDYRNSNEAVFESKLDIEEGADIIMVKPALSYCDIIYKIKQELKRPLAAYNVSGEYSMVKAASSKGWVDENKLVLEILYSIKRAGADMIITYHAYKIADYIE
ncbi:MAG: delta-aminolevulinic acid dehydratase [Candidatus Sericytochromatia bacterium]|nr:MAG: delta-aminolevulinic acid dehydratase [Candidatus Sericytochromatia bacterium]